MTAKTVKLPKGYKPSGKEEYMNPKQIEYFRQKLTTWRDDLVDESRETISNLQSEVRDVGDEAERATRETENSLELRTRDRYRKLINKIKRHWLASMMVTTVIARKPAKRLVYRDWMHVRSRPCVSMRRSAGKYDKSKWATLLRNSSFFALVAHFVAE